MKLSAAAGAALAAAYVAPSFTTVGVPRAFAGLSFGDIIDCQLCDKLGKPRVLTMQLLETSLPPDEGHDQEAGKVTVVGNGSLPDPVYVRASDKSNSFDGKARIWFAGLVNVGNFFDINSISGVKNNGDLDPKDSVLSKKLSREVRQYARKQKKDGTLAANQPHIEIARDLGRRGRDVSEGTRIEYIVTEASSWPLKAVWINDFEKGTEDRFYLWENLIYPATQRVLESAFPERKWKAYLKARPKKPRKVKAPDEKPKRRGKKVNPGQ
ncbi:MAG: hypothetical protein IIC30_03090, partial [Chloroflexi bacterium]|nr:hypothetical protein [Chloroflexota bacterium]